VIKEIYGDLGGTVAKDKGKGSSCSLSADKSKMVAHWQIRQQIYH